MLKELVSTHLDMLLSHEVEEYFTYPGLQNRGYNRYLQPPFLSLVYIFWAVHFLYPLHCCWGGCRRLQMPAGTQAGMKFFASGAGIFKLYTSPFGSHWGFLSILNATYLGKLVQ